MNQVRAQQVLEAHGLVAGLTRSGRKVALTEVEANVESGPSASDWPEVVATGRTWAQVLRKVEAREARYHLVCERQQLVMARERGGAA